MLTRDLIRGPAKRCSRCGLLKRLEDYHNHRDLRRCPDGRQAYCRACMRAYNRSRRLLRMADAEYRRIEAGRLRAINERLEKLDRLTEAMLSCRTADAMEGSR